MLPDSTRHLFIKCIFLLCTSSTVCLGQIFSSEVETSTEDPLTSCDPPWRQHNDKCYFTTSGSGQGSTLPYAKQACRRFGGDLAKPSSADEHTFIRRILVSYNATWIGAVDNDRKAWWDGSPMLYHNFHVDSNESVSCPVQCCGLTTNRHGEWNYASCSSVLNFVCVKTNETIASYRLSLSKKVQQEQELAAATEKGKTTKEPQSDGNSRREKVTKDKNNCGSSNHFTVIQSWWSFVYLGSVVTIFIKI